MNVKPAVRARRIRFSYPTGSLERHFVRGDLTPLLGRLGQQSSKSQFD